MKIETNTLLKQIQTGDKKAFQELFNRYYKILLAIAINLVKDVNTAKDVVQEVFLQVWKNREKLNIQSNAESYLKKSVVNRSLNFLKARKPMVSDDALLGMDGKAIHAIQNLEAADLEEAIQKALQLLPERCRLVFVMRRMEGYSLKEIAEKLDISPKTAENQITKALKILKEAVRPFVENS